MNIIKLKAGLRLAFFIYEAKISFSIFPRHLKEKDETYVCIIVNFQVVDDYMEY
ncbi:hypothetical protein [Pradoshia sp. D12]|uniref:hypothetical protein n=1 Tax=Pradoshia sp. D12 TaxID=2651284 RepID=UPI00178C420D|nr:hypothetical protein [Pradoshia sp. D12]